MDGLNVAVYEGEHPSSSYQAAEMPMDIAEANAIAGVRGLPWRFVADRGSLRRRCAVRRKKPRHGAGAASCILSEEEEDTA